jgi:hypothetical protein
MHENSSVQEIQEKNRFLEDMTNVRTEPGIG